MNTWREELAWAAGFFDGEGTFLLVKQDGRNGARASVAQTDREILERFQRAVLGVGTIGKPVIVGNRKPIWNWYICNAQGVQAVAAMLWPFLGHVKRAQAMPVLTGMRWRTGRRKTHCKNGHELTPENTRTTIGKNGRLDRACRPCSRAYTAKWRAAQKDAA